MQKKQKIPFTMDMKGTPRFAKFAILSMLLLAATQAVCQERIDEIDYVDDVKSSVKRFDDSTTYFCTTEGDYSYYSKIPDNSTNVRVFPLKGHDHVYKITDFTMFHDRIYVCGMVYEDSTWFTGWFTGTGTGSYLNMVYMRIPYVSHLAKIEVIPKTGSILVAGNDNFGKGALYEAHVNAPGTYNIYKVTLHDTSLTDNYFIDDMLVMENYIVLSSHLKSNLPMIFAPKGRLWFVNKPTNASTHITTSTVVYEDIKFYTRSAVCLASQTSTIFYVAGSGYLNFFDGITAQLSLYHEQIHQKTLSVSSTSGALAVSYNKVSQKCEIPVYNSTYVHNHLVGTDYDEVLTINKELSVGSTGVHGHKFSGHRLYSISSYPNTANRFVVSSKKTSGTNNSAELIYFDTPTFGDCSTEITHAASLYSNSSIDVIQMPKYPITYTVNIESDSFAGINIPVTNSCGNNK